MDMLTKTYKTKALLPDDAPAGRSLAIKFADLEMVDSDNDTYAADAFAESMGRRIPLGFFNHANWNGNLPYGAGEIKMDGNSVIWAGEVLETARGDEAHKYAVAMGNDLEVSYQFHGVGIPNANGGTHWQKVDVQSVDYVFRGAGPDTGLLETKKIEQADSAKQDGAKQGGIAAQVQVARQKLLRAIGGL